MQAPDRTRPLLPMRPGIPARRTHDYIRHGTKRDLPNLVSRTRNVKPRKSGPTAIEALAWLFAARRVSAVLLLGMKELGIARKGSGAAHARSTKEQS